MPRKAIFISLIAIVVLSMSAFAQGKRSMTIDDLITTVRVSEPQLSPDGKRVIFTRTTTAVDTGKRKCRYLGRPGGRVGASQAVDYQR
jgi:hypothetical protein